MTVVRTPDACTVNGGHFLQDDAGPQIAHRINDLIAHMTTATSRESARAS